MMELLPAEIAAKLPPIYTHDGNTQAPVVLKLFDPCSPWTWYATEYDPEERVFFGFVVGHEEELGYFSLDELQSVKNSLGLPLERDLYWNPETPLTKVMSGEVR